MSTPDYGRAVDLRDDLPAGRWSYATGYRNLVNAIYRRLTTPRGSLRRHPAYGFDLRDLIGETVTTVQVRAWETQIAAECERDDRVESATASITYAPSGRSFRLALLLSTAAGPFRLVLGVSEVTIEILELA